MKLEELLPIVISFLALLCTFVSAVVSTKAFKLSKEAQKLSENLQNEASEIAKLNRDTKLKDILREIKSLLKTEGDDWSINYSVLGYEELDQAKHLLDQYLPIYPDNIELNLMLAEYYFRLYDKAYDNVKGDFGAYWMKEIDAFTYTENSLYHNELALQQAYDAIYKAAAIDPNHVKVLESLATYYIKYRRNNKGCEYERKAAESGSSKCLVNVGVRKYKAGNLDEAEHLFQKAIAVNSSNGVAYQNLATILLDKTESNTQPDELTLAEVKRLYECAYRLQKRQSRIASVLHDFLTNYGFEQEALNLKKEMDRTGTKLLAVK